MGGFSLSKSVVLCQHGYPSCHQFDKNL